VVSTPGTNHRRQRAAAAGIATKLGNHSFRATGITAYLKNGGTLASRRQCPVRNDQVNLRTPDHFRKVIPGQSPPSRTNPRRLEAPQRPEKKPPRFPIAWSTKLCAYNRCGQFETLRNK
jgi:hypothetical protein